MGFDLKWLSGNRRAGGLVRTFSAWSARLLDAVPGATPNRITLLGLVLALLAILLFAVGAIALGAIVCGLSFLTDVFDGALAEYQEALLTPSEKEAECRKPWLAQRGKTSGGRWFGLLAGAAFDPFVDKVRFFGAVLALGIGRFWWPLFVIGGAFAVGLTFLRGYAHEKRLSTGESNWFGKHKVHAEAALLAWLVFVPAGTMSSVDDALMIAAVIGGASSFSSQAYAVRRNAKAPT